MAISLITTHPAGLVVKSGGDSFVLTTGKRIQLRHNESGTPVDFLDETVPNGKEWEVSINIHVRETVG